MISTHRTSFAVSAGWRRLRRIWRRPEADIDAELRFHLDERVADLVARGESAESARAHAIEEFGDVAEVRAELLEIDQRAEAQRKRADWWEGVAQDARHVARGLMRSPGFTVMVVATLALGIGANAVVFSLIDRLFFQPPAGVPHPEMVRRVQLRYINARSHEPTMRGVYNYPEVRSVAEAAPAGVTVAAYVNDDVQLGRDASAPSAQAAYVVGDYFGVLGVRPEAGRFFAPDEQAPTGLTPVAVISHALWQRHFSGRRDVLGEQLQLGAHTYTIIGVAPARFEGVELGAVELWLPYNTKGRWNGREADWYEEPHTLYLRMLARVSVRSELTSLATSAGNALSASEIMRGSLGTATLASLGGAPQDAFYSGEFSISRRLAGVATIIFLIACANVANLLLVRALGRRRETALRLALGVSRRRLAAQFMAEAMLVAAMGGCTALFLTWWGSNILRRTILPWVQWGSGVLTWRVIVFTIVVTPIAGMVAGLVPAIQGGDPDLSAALRGGVREGRTMRSRTRTTLLIVQAALSVVLLAGAGLFVRSLRQVEAIDIGYDADRLIFAEATPAQEDTSSSRRIEAALPDLADRLTHIPDVERVALAQLAPTRGFSIEKVFIPGIDSLAAIGPFGMPIISAVSPEYFATAGITVRSGRGFTTADRADAEPVVVVNQTMARSYWPNGDVLGSCIMLGERTAPCRRVIGIATDAHIRGVVEEAAPAYYVPLAQAPDQSGAGVILIRARPDRLEEVSAAVAREMKGVLGTFATPWVQPMRATLADELHQWRLGASLFSVAGLLALLVAAVGIYSTVAYMVGERTHEIGVRIALGARSANIARVVIAHGLTVVVAGVAIGVLAALALGRLVSSLLYGVTPRDPVVLGSVAAVLLLVAVAACLVPAWRAARVDPVEALRAE